VELIPLLSSVIFIATIVTILLATFSYAAFKLRNRRKPRAMSQKPVYFRRIDPHAAAAEQRRAGA
jgi:hypothetical protein